jgi:hypothetical protein
MSSLGGARRPAAGRERLLGHVQHPLGAAFTLRLRELAQPVEELAGMFLMVSDTNYLLRPCGCHRQPIGSHSTTGARCPSMFVPLAKATRRPALLPWRRSGRPDRPDPWRMANPGRSRIGAVAWGRLPGGQAATLPPRQSSCHGSVSSTECGSRRASFRRPWWGLATVLLRKSGTRVTTALAQLK